MVAPVALVVGFWVVEGIPVKTNTLLSGMGPINSRPLKKNTVVTGMKRKRGSGKRPVVRKIGRFLVTEYWTIVGECHG
jgi:hypothetical protein